MLNTRTRRLFAVGLVLLVLAGAGNLAGLMGDIRWLVIAGGVAYVAAAVVLIVAASRQVVAREDTRRAVETPTGSLIQQRIRLDRERTSAVWMTAAATVYVPLSAVGLIIDPTSVFRWVTVAFGVVVLGFGVVSVRRARRRARAFDADHGENAGRQSAVS